MNLCEIVMKMKRFCEMMRLLLGFKEGHDAFVWFLRREMRLLHGFEEENEAVVEI
jgi:hypothetical protein